MTAAIFDDDHSAVRRNIVAFSTAIVLGWWLDVTLSDLVKQLTQYEFLLAPDKLVAATLAIAIYLGIRYRWEVADEQASQLEAIHSQLVFDRIYSVLNRGVRRRDAYTGVSFSPSLQSCINEAREEAEKIARGTRLYLKEVSWSHQNESPTLKGQVRIRIKWGIGLISSDHDVQRLVNYEMSFVARAFLRGTARLQSTLYSKPSQRHVAPVLLYGAALFVLIGRVVQSYLPV